LVGGLQGHEGEENYNALEIQKRINMLGLLMVILIIVLIQYSTLKSLILWRWCENSGNGCRRKVVGRIVEVKKDGVVVVERWRRSLYFC
jgi:hypothetical protein